MMHDAGPAWPGTLTIVVTVGKLGVRMTSWRSTPYAQLEVQYMTPAGTGDNYLLLSASQLTTGTWLPASALFVTTDQASLLYLHLDSGSDSP
jgi:hypothetical protein